ncbi:hypothetical protein GQ43DRAFT_445699 [Delitschia confertaspora ATCC 74209]|uniref:LisH domain-containing protein n=1 Tax=Delitschia confertaspora ATCC 74209 TaxID=1513339 RepID=A0A9P4N029_9PLEO|nr:hypothetical protein GQ43DRAFT_445699 [Delitschia confertaspora ATCC 74209]
MLPSAAILVARFLKANGYDETLKTFIREAGLAPDVASGSPIDVTIEQILEEKKKYDLTVQFEKLGVEDEDKGWRIPAPSKSTVLDMLPSASNILSVYVEQLTLLNESPQPYLLTTSADRRLSILKPSRSSLELVRSYTGLQDSPILDMAVLEQRYILLASMSGRLVLYDLCRDELLDERRDQSKFIVKVTSWTDHDTTYIATAGWDSKVILYCMKLNNGQEPRIGDPVASLTLQTIPETVIFVQPVDTTPAVLLVTRRDSTSLYYYTLPNPGVDNPELKLLGTQNLAPHSNAWVAFTPSAVQICPIDPTIAAIATSSVPHMKLIIVRLLIPPNAANASDNNVHDLGQVSGAALQHTTQASQARAELVKQDREEAAILVQCSTLSSQTQYSTPALAWRPNGSGVWVNGDDGIVRGIEANTGKIVVRLEAHEPGSKVRCLWAGVVHPDYQDDQPNTQEEEWVVSGGFDQRLVVGKAQ